MANAPNAKSKGNSLTLATAISFRTGLRMYHEDKTRKNRKLASKESLVKTDRDLVIMLFVFFID